MTASVVDDKTMADPPEDEVEALLTAATISDVPAEEQALKTT